MPDERWTWRLEFDLPDGTLEDPYDPDELAQQLRELADLVERYDGLPPSGDVWGRDGRLIVRALLFDQARRTTT